MYKNEKLDVIVETKALLHALMFANSVIEKRNILPELNNVRLKTKDNLITIFATDSDLYLSQSVGAHIVYDGDTTVSSQALADVVKKMSDQEIRLLMNYENNQFEVLGQNCHFKLLTLPSNKFPTMEDFFSEFNFIISSSSFIKLIEYTQFSISTDETRYSLSGMFLHIKDRVIYAVATDGHRLSIASNEVECGNHKGVIIPRKTIDAILKIIKDSKNPLLDLNISIGINKIKFNYNNTILISKLIDGEFPNYMDFIPIKSSSELIISSRLLSEVVERVSTITIEKFKSIRVKLDTKILEVNASGEARGSAVEIVNYSDECKKECKFTGKNLIIGFNPKYLLDVLHVLRDKQIKISFQDSNSSALIKVLNSDKYMFIIMPVKV